MKVADFGLSKLVKIDSLKEVYIMTGETGSCRAKIYFSVPTSAPTSFTPHFAIYFQTGTWLQKSLGMSPMIPLWMFSLSVLSFMRSSFILVVFSLPPLDSPNLPQFPLICTNFPLIFPSRCLKDCPHLQSPTLQSRPPGRFPWTTLGLQ